MKASSDLDMVAGEYVDPQLLMPPGGRAHRPDSNPQRPQGSGTAKVMVL